jgi:cobalt-zinc-cadmium efflux system outer membrane protein
MLRKIKIYLACLGTLCISTQSFALDFQETWQRIQNNNPSLAAESWKINSSAGKVEQARLLPNPTVGAMVENLGAKQEGEESQEVQSTLMVNQPILLGKKYRRRIQLKNAEYKAQRNNYSLAYVSLYSEAGQKYVDVLVAQQLQNTIKESVKIAELTATTIKKRTKAGRSSQLELKSAQVALGEAKIQLLIAETQLCAARAELAALWGETDGNIGVVQDKGLPHSLLPLCELLKYVPHSPLIRNAIAQTQVGYKQILTSQSEAWPDLNVGIGARHFQQSHQNAVVAEVSMPLTIFNRNEGNIHSSIASYTEKVAMQKAAFISVQKQIYILYQKAVQANSELDILEHQLIPTANSAFELAKQGYLHGRFSYLDLLNAQNKLIETRRRYWQIHGMRDKILIEIYSMLGLINQGKYQC